MKLPTLSLAFFLFILLTGCTIEKCGSNLYTSDGKCCTYTCEKECPTGYKQATCNCECKETTYVENPQEYQDTNIDQLFDDGSDINPPELPI